MKKLIRWVKKFFFPRKLKKQFKKYPKRRNSDSTDALIFLVKYLKSRDPLCKTCKFNETCLVMRGSSVCQHKYKPKENNTIGGLVLPTKDLHKIMIKIKPRSKKCIGNR